MLRKHFTIIKTAVLFAVSLFVLSVFILNVNPVGKPIVYLLLPTMLLWVAGFSLLLLLGMMLTSSKTPTNTLFVSSFIAVSTTVLLLMLSGVGQLGAGDIILVVLLVAVGTFYFRRTWN